MALTVSSSGVSASTGAPSAYGPKLPGTGFDSKPPLAIVSGIFKFLKSLGLRSIGLSIACVPFHGGWALVAWKPTLSLTEQIGLEFDRICAEIEAEENVRSGFLEILEIVDETELEVSKVFVGPQIELFLGEETLEDGAEQVEEVPRGVPMVMVEDDGSSVEIISTREIIPDQAEGTEKASVPVSSSDDRSGAEPDPMDVDARTGEVPVQTGFELGRGDSVDRTGEVPVQEVVGTGTRQEPVPAEVEQYSGGALEMDSGLGALRIEDFPGDEFEKVRELSPEGSTETPLAPSSEQPAESPSSGEPRKKRIKTLAGRTDLPWVRKLQALRAKTSSSAPKSPPAQPSRKSHRLMAQEIRARAHGQKTPVIDLIQSSSEGSPVKVPVSQPDQPAETPVQKSEQASTESSPHKSPSSKPVPKRKAVDLTPASHSTEPFAKKPNAAITPSPKLEKFQKRGVVRGKVVKVQYFQDQGLEVFLNKLKAQGWLDLFTNTQLVCSPPDLAEFYANVTLHGEVITSTVNGVLVEVNAQALGVILGVPSTSFDLYLKEDRSLLSRERLVELSRRLSQQPGLTSPQSVKKGDMLPLHQLLFWFIIKNVIPRAQGRNQADAMDQCLIDLMDKEQQINLPAFMINHIMRIATTTRAHDLGYGFLLTKVFQHFGIELRQKVKAQAIDEVGSSTIMGCGYTLLQPGDRRTAQGAQPSAAPAPAHGEEQGAQVPTVGGSVPAPLLVPPITMPDQGLRDDLSVLQREFQEEKELNAKRHADLLALLQALIPKPPAP